jgi:hypothetical protein
MRPWSEVFCYWLADSHALATLVLIAVVGALALLRQPARRLSVARSAVLGLAALTLLAALPGWPQVRWSTLPVWREPTRLPDVGAARHDPPRVASPQTTIQPPPLEVPSADPIGPPALGRGEMNRNARAIEPPAVRAKIALPGWPTLAGLVFLMGGSLMLVWLGLGFWQTAAMRRRARRAPDWLQDALVQIVCDGSPPPALLLSERLRQPVAVGLRRPAIILPERFAEDEAAPRLEAALAHEWAHIRNRDLWWLALSLLLMPIFFAHPLYWWLRRRMRDDQEVLADAAAAATGRVGYAEMLLSWATARRERPGLAVAGSVALWERSSQLKQRIIMLLDRNFHVEPACPKRWGFGVRGGMAMAVLALSVLTFRPVTVEADPPPAPQVKNGSSSGTTIHVLDPDGNPVMGARVFRSEIRYDLDNEPRTAARVTETNPEGSFQLAPADLKDVLDKKAQFVVMAEGYGSGVVDPSFDTEKKMLRLVPDDVPIRGRLLDIQGQPVAGAKVQLVGIYWHPSGTLDPWLDSLKTENFFYHYYVENKRLWSGDDVSSLIPPVVTDREGWFTLKGVGPERIALLLIRGPKMETRFEYVATREMPAFQIPKYEMQLGNEFITCYGATLNLVASPGLEVVGTVRDKDTGKPLAGATVQAAALIGIPYQLLKTTTDAEGRYRLMGIPRKTQFGDGQEVVAEVKGGPPYLPSIQSVGDTLGPITRNFELKRGVWARGRITDKSNGKPVQANLSYWVFEDNPHAKDYPPYGTVRVGDPFLANEKGEFQIAVLPGHGILGARHFPDGTYRLDVGINTSHGVKVDGSGPFPLIRHDHNTYVEIDPKPGDESITANIELDPGRTVKGTLIGPDGEPVAGARMMGAWDWYQNWSSLPQTSADFEVRALGPEDKRGLIFVHDAKKLAGAYVVQPGEEGPLKIQLQPCGTLTGRLVDRDAVPQPRFPMECDRPYEGGDFRYEYGALQGLIRTDKDGRFQASGLVPGLKYSLTLRKAGKNATSVKDVIVKAGETRDLGDVKIVERSR